MLTGGANTVNISLMQSTRYWSLRANLSIKLMQNILGYPEFEVKKITETADTYEVTAELLSVLKSCESCGSDNVVNFGWVNEKLADTPVNNKKSIINLARRRQRCNDCGKTFSISAPHKYGSRQLTERLANHIGWSCIKESFSKVAKNVGVTKNTARDIFIEFCERQNEQLTANLASGKDFFRTPKTLGIEGISAVSDSTLFSNVGNQSILNIIPSQSTIAINEFVVKNINTSEVEFVMISPCESYLTAAKRLFPNAIIILNKMHAFSVAEDSVERVHLAARVGLSAKQVAKIRVSSSILHKRQHELNEGELVTLDSLLVDSPVIHQAYVLKEMFYRIWSHETNEDAELAYEEWLVLITPNLSSYFEPLVNMVTQWHKELFANIEHKQHPRYLEMVKGVVEEVNTLSRSSSFLTVWATLLLDKDKSTYGIDGMGFASR